MKIALSHDWLNGMRGGEKCLEAFCEIFPDSPIYTLFYEQGKVSETIAARPIHASFIQRLPGVFTRYRYYLSLFPSAIESFRPEGCELIISTSHCVSKGLRKPAGAKHLCYCFTPMRYAWGFFEEYFGRRGALSRWFIQQELERLKSWDIRASRNVDQFIAISDHVRKRIENFYRRDAEVIFPPVETDFYSPDASVQREDSYLIVSALVPYKRVDIAIRAFNDSGKKLVIIGDGPELGALKKLADPNIQFLGWQTDAVLRDHYRRTRALIFPGEEDFGIVPVEIQSCGGTVIAYKKGGALETLLEGETGLFFEELTPQSLSGAVERSEKISWDPRASRLNALRFSRARFKDEIRGAVRRLMNVPEGICV